MQTVENLICFDLVNTSAHRHSLYFVPGYRRITVQQPYAPKPVYQFTRGWYPDIYKQQFLQLVFTDNHSKYKYWNTHHKFPTNNKDIAGSLPIFMSDLLRTGSSEGSSLSCTFCSNTGIPNCSAPSKVLI